MKISDFIFRYPSYSRHDSICRLRLYVHDGRTVAIATELDGNTGASITNSIEYLWRALVEQGHVNTSVTLIEHYERSGFFERNDFDLVTIAANSPTWADIEVQELVALTGGDESELISPTKNSKRLLGEIGRLRTSIEPHADLSYPESVAVVKRQLEIQDQMIPKGTIQALIQAGAGERQLQDVIKSDLSLIAEPYASPPEEYICFAEYPIGDGFADFVLFTGRSRMDVIVFEIKGADFPVLNGSGRRNLSAKLNEAAQQARSRLAHVYRNYNGFRLRAHEIRSLVEQRQLLHGAFIGPHGPVPQVDPEKDINLHGVLIAGRTNDDLLESSVRHEFEMQTAPRLRVESWDSWVRKLRRA
ncbi:MAG: DUF4263 domain-containing protein [bacterium]|nr:DUF4263 domain-containing protein [bacterium]